MDHEIGLEDSNDWAEAKANFAEASRVARKLNGPGRLVRRGLRADDYDDRMTTTVMAGRMAR
jgi:hypothetical protein